MDENGIKDEMELTVGNHIISLRRLTGIECQIIEGVFDRNGHVATTKRTVGLTELDDVEDVTGEDID
jgi:hypothetical protein